MTIRTVMHTYALRLNEPAEREEYERITGPLIHDGRHAMFASGEYTLLPLGRPLFKTLTTPIEIETEHIFENQWNTAPFEGCDKGARVFDWAESRNGNWKTFRRGHYLEITEEMRELRRNTMGCGYCGKQEPAAKGYVFCPHCLDSEYLKESDLHLTRMRPMDTPFNESRPPLTDAEKAYLVPLYTNAQIHGSTERGTRRIAAQRERIKAQSDSVVRHALDECNGMLWLLDHGVSIDNVIYYSHTGRFAFGWRTPLSRDVHSRLLDILCEFPFDYDLKVEPEVRYAS